MLSEKDLHMLGGTTFQGDNNGTNFIVESNVEILILRSLIKSLGFEVLSEEDFCWEHDDGCDIEVKTTYPWDKYMAPFQKNNQKSGYFSLGSMVNN